PSCAALCLSSAGSRQSTAARIRKTRRKRSARGGQEPPYKRSAPTTLPQRDTPHGSFLRGCNISFRCAIFARS
ncbi:hypothetical protein FOZ62_021081, partial [Perkinsus olseni]